MRAILSFLILLPFFSCASGKETYIGCTPANSNAIRNFLGISLTDSVDFIRWKISFQGDQYNLKCNYGIGKQNTKDFISGGKWAELSGSFRKEKNYYSLQSGNKTLNLVEFNSSLLHLLDENKKLLNGTGGWSYTLSLEKGVAL